MTEAWISELPGAVRVPVLAFSDPHPPGARARALLAAQAIVALARAWPTGRDGLDIAVAKLVANLHAVGQTTLHQPGVRNMIDYVLAEGVPHDSAAATTLFEGKLGMATEIMTRASQTMARLGADLLSDGDRILVHDFADRSTQEVVRQAALDRKRLTVIATACRSRRTDGIRVARESQAVGHHAIVVTDAGIGWAVGHANLRLCLIGADAVLSDGTVLTSPGALTIALVGRQVGVPVYAVTDLWKIMAAVSPELTALNVAEDPDGVPEAVEWKAAGYGYFNPLVDFVPGETLTGLITEAGILNPADAGAAAAQRYGLGGAADAPGTDQS